jgi:hypothetical protein
MRIEIPEYNTTVEFPDDMAPEKIQEILAKEFPYTGSIEPRQGFNLGQSIQSFLADPGLALQNTGKDIAGTVGGLIHGFGQGFMGNLPAKITSKVGNQISKSMEKSYISEADRLGLKGKEREEFLKLSMKNWGETTPEEVTGTALKNVIQNTGSRESIVNNPTTHGLGQFGGQVAGDMMLLGPIGKTVSSGVSSLPQLANNPLAQKVLGGLMTAVPFEIAKKGIEEGRLPTPHEYGTDLAFFAASPVGGQLVGEGLQKVAPKLPEIIKAPIEGAAEGVTGLTASMPFMSEEERKNISLEYGPTAGAMALLKTAGALGKPKSPIAEVISKPKEVVANAEMQTGREPEKVSSLIKNPVEKAKLMQNLSEVVNPPKFSPKTQEIINVVSKTLKNPVDPGELHLAFEAKSKGLDWFKKEFKDIPEPETAFKELTSKIESLKPNEQSRLKFDLQMFATNNPDFSKAAKERLINLYGAIPRGEAPRLRNIDVPAATDAGKTRQFARTAYEILPKEAARQTMEDVMAGKFAYEPISNKETIRKAEAELNTGADEAYQKWQGVLKSGKQITADDLALGEALLTKAARDKDLTKVSQLTIDLASELTNAGQVVQAARLLKKMSPEGYGVYVERQIKKANTEFKNKYGDKFKGFKLTEANRKAILEAPTTEERERVAMDIAKRMAQEAPVSLMEKFNAWRRIAMLLNPRTHFRNITGNAISLRKIADTVGAGLENALKVPEGKRTKAVGWSKDSSLIKLVDESWEANKKKLTSSGRWDISQILGQEKRIFKTKPIESLSRFSKNTLEAEDVWFLRRAYQDALGQYLKANNLKIATDAAVNYATRKAQEATYRDVSALANLLNKVKREGGSVGTALEALMPFTKTPINIARRGIEYSPVGLVRGLSNYFGKVKKGQMEATEAIEQLAKGLTGTGAMTLGIILAKLGVITGAEDDDIDKAAFDKAVGKQPFAVNIGGHYYTWDWAQPISLPVAMGAQIYQSIKNNEGLVNSLLSATASGADVLLNLPLFQGIKRTLKGFALSPEYGAQSAANAMFDIFDSYVRQAVPVLGGQIARTFDRTVRTTYTPKGEKGILSAFGTRAQGFGKYVQSRTPGLSQQLPAKITTLGEKVEQPKSMAARAFLNFVSPGFYSKYKDSPAIKLVETVYKETGDKRIFPRVAPKTITVDNKTYILSAKEYSRFQQYIGQAAKEGYEQLAGSGSFASETNENKVKIMKKVLDDAFDIAKAKLMSEKGIEPVSTEKAFKFGF